MEGYCCKIGQTNIVSMLLIIGILVAAIASAYLWGFPILQKSEDRSKIDQTKIILSEIADAIEIVARDHVSRTIPIVVNGQLKITNISLDLTTVSDAAYQSTSRFVALNEDDYQGIPGILEDGFGLIGKDKPAVLIARSLKEETKIKNQFRIITRELEDVNSQIGTQIVFEPKGKSAVASGKYKVILNYERDETVIGGSKTGGDLRTTTISVRIA